MKSSSLPANKRTKSSLKKMAVIRRKLLNWRERSNNLTRVIMTSQSRSGKRKKPFSNFQEKFTTLKWNWTPKRPKKIKSSNLLTLNGHWNTMQCVMNTSKEFSWSKRKNNSLIREFRKSKPKLESFWLKLRSTKLTAKTPRESSSRKSRTCKKTDSQSSPRRTTKSRESRKKTSKTMTDSSKNKPKTANFRTNSTSPELPFPNLTWRRRRAKKRSRASTRFTKLSLNSWRKRRPITSNSRRAWLIISGKPKEKWEKQFSTSSRIC